MYEYVNLGEHKFIFLYNLIMKMIKIHLDISGELRFIEFEYHVVSMVDILIGYITPIINLFTAYDIIYSYHTKCFV